MKYINLGRTIFGDALQQCAGFNNVKIRTLLYANPTLHRELALMPITEYIKGDPHEQR